MERDAALKDLEVARGEFAAALEGVPDAALQHLKGGDDYCLSGLVPHCEYVLRHYAAVLDGMAGGREFRAVDPDELTEWHLRSAREGFTAAERAAALAALAKAHEAAAERLQKSAGWEAKVPVLYGADAADPFPTSAADIAGWLSDHYREHVPHISDLIADWEAAQPVQGV